MGARVSGAREGARAAGPGQRHPLAHHATSHPATILVTSMSSPTFKIHFTFIRSLTVIWEQTLVVYIDLRLC